MNRGGGIKIGGQCPLCPPLVTRLYGWYCVMNGYCETKGLINVVFALAFLCLLVAYISLFQFIIILLVHNKGLRFESSCVRTHKRDFRRGGTPKICKIFVSEISTDIKKNCCSSLSQFKKHIFGAPFWES